MCTPIDPGYDTDSNGCSLRWVSRNSGCLVIPGIILLMSLSIGLLPVARVIAADENLVSNPGFEMGSDNNPTFWAFVTGAPGNTFEWVSDDVHSGEKALKMVSINPPPSGTSMGVFSNAFRAPVHSRVEVVLWMKANEVENQGNLSWFRLRVTLVAYNESGDRIQHEDILSEEGSSAWKAIRGGMIVPEGTDTMDLSVKLTTSTGTVWVDDVEVKVAKELPSVDLTGIYNPVLVPQPWKIKDGNDKLDLEKVVIVNQSGDGRIEESVASFFGEIDVTHEFLLENDPNIRHYSTLFVLGDSTSPLLCKQLSRRFPNHDWSDLGEQGYFLAINKDEVQGSIYAGANSDVGRFFALQTLKQLTVSNTIYMVDILDRPTINSRGIPLSIQWFEKRNDETLKRLTQLKFNFVWTQGSFLNNSTSTDNWRVPFSDLQKTLLQEFIELYQKNFIEVWTSIQPRGKDPPLQYSSDSDINTIVFKMDVLYGLGVRHFGLSFADLENTGEDELLVQEDIRLFNNDIGSAQVYLINEVYRRLIDIHSDIHFMVLPMNYNQSGNFGNNASANLQQFHELPHEIRIYSVPCYDEDVLATTRLTGRPRMTMWTNFYAGNRNPHSKYAMPYLNFINWQDPRIRMKLDGFTWLPAMPENEDAALISWYTAADFAWAPERYDPDTSFQLAAARYLGVPDKQ